MVRLTVVLVTLTSAPILVAQQPTPAATSSAFEVASIKPNPNGVGSSVAGISARGYMMRNSAIDLAITTAYPGMAEIIGAPAWITSERFDINAVAGRDTTSDEVRTMLRALLADRFKLAVREETREQPIYVLRLARVDGRLGPELRRSELDCDAIATARKAGRPIPPLANGALPCMMSVAGGARGAVTAAGRPLSELAAAISGPAGRRVVDRTGLAGNFDFAVRFSGGLQAPGSDRADDLPTLTTALQEQLGLKLESDRMAMKVLVIDRIERPTPN